MGRKVQQKPDKPREDQRQTQRQRQRQTEMEKMKIGGTETQNH